MDAIFGLVSMLAAVTAAAQAPVPPDSGKVQVMVLGAYHFANPGRDKVNAQVDDVTTPRRQRELDALADAILAFHPTKVMVEKERKGPEFAVAEYRAFNRPIC